MSTDSTLGILERYHDRISVVLREPDSGQGDAIVKGFKLAKGEIVGWINSDDLLYPDCVVRVVEAYQANPTAAILYCSRIDIISELGGYIKTMHVPLVSMDHLLRERNTLIQPGSFYRREALERVAYFDTNLRYSMDLDLWLRLLTVGGFVNVSNSPIAAYREWGGTKTATGGKQLASERVAMLQRHGGKASDPSQRRINGVSRIDHARKLFKRTAELLLTLPSIFSLVIYYGFLVYLPASNSRFTLWIRPIRSWVGQWIFKRCGHGINIEQGARFGTGKRVEIGDRSGLGVNCRVWGSVRIGDHVMMGPDVLFISTAHRFERTDVLMDEQGFAEDRIIVVENDVWIGARCTILPGVRIGTGSVIGAGSVVAKSIPDYAVAVGNPARVVRRRPRSGQCDE